MSFQNVRLLRLALSALACLFLATASQALTPTTMSFQGRLTDAGGVPVADGAHGVTFRIYNTPTGGMIFWVESATVTTTEGLFATVLGVSNPLTALVFADSSRYLGITVGADPELTPRTRLTATPYALRVATVDGAGGGYVYGNPSPTDVGSAHIYNYGGQGTALDLSDESGSVHIGLEPDFDGSGGYLDVNGPTGAFIVDGNFGSGGNPLVSISGNQSGTIFNTGTSGDPAVILPNNAVSAKEILDEPGLTGNFSFGPVLLNRSSMADLATTSITIPAPGYVLALGNVGEFDFKGTTGYNWVFAQIDTGSIGSMTPDLTVLGAYAFPDTNYYFYSFSGQRIFFLSTAGTYTFRVQAVQSGSAAPSATVKAYSSKISAVYIPTSYGPVTVPVPAGNLSPFDQTSSEKAQMPAGGGLESSANVYKADLRELELKVAKADAEAQKARAALAEAQLRKQIEARPTSVTTDGNK